MRRRARSPVTAARRTRTRSAPAHAHPAETLSARSRRRALAGQALSVVMVAAEATPYAKAGGLGDVLQGLPQALVALGHEVTVVLPRYRESRRAGSPRGRIQLTLGRRTYRLTFIEAGLGATGRLVQLECPELYDREGIYGVDGRDYADNAVRFGALALAGLEWAVRQPPAIIHLHDWQAALVPAFLRTTAQYRDQLRDLRSVLTIHNLSYQGIFPARVLRTVGLDSQLAAPEAMGHPRGVSFLRAGIRYADAITSVSPRYAREILTPELGHGLDALLVTRRRELSGIVNGIDTSVWDPRTDPHLPVPYSARSVAAGKRAAKRQLLERVGLPSDAGALVRPLVGMVTRLVPQKGLDLIAEVASDLAQLDATFVLLGSGMPQYEQLLSGLAHAYPERFGVVLGFDEGLAHLIEGGADIFLMPSRFEPCGLNQLYSLRYGTVPIVRAVGGLHDTIRPYDPRSGRGTGFRFSRFSGQALLTTLRRALRLYEDRPAWRRLQQAGMREDHSWDASARKYVKVYERVIRRPGRGVL